MDIKIDLRTPQEAIVSPSGRMDAVSSSEVQQSITKLVQDGARVIVVDLEQVTFMDSSGLRVLVAGLKLLRRSGGAPLLICGANSQIRTALRLTMLDRVFPIYKNVDEALENAETPTPWEDN